MGDVTNDGLHSYAWDAETRPTTIDSVTVTYDALGRMVEQNKSGSYTEIVYDCLGNKLALMNGASTLKEAFVPLPGGATAVYNASGLEYYRHPDWLGSSRFSSTPSRTLYNDLAYAPFGETYATSGTTSPTNISFAGNNEDTTTNAYDAMFREYGIQGRWPSPDPAGVAAANPANPQSWNRYAYVQNNPLGMLDPSGLGCTQWGTFESFDGGITWNLIATYWVCDDSGGGNNGPSPNPKPKLPPCTATQKLAGQLGQALDKASDNLNLIAIAGGVATFIGGLGELPSGGLDTPGTITAGTFTAAAEGGSLITGAAGAVFDSYANGNTSALRNFNADNLIGLGVTLAASRIPFVNRLGQTIGDLAQQGLSLAQQTQGGCQ
jgi:RHS repeat-associated protein